MSQFHAERADMVRPFVVTGGRTRVDNSTLGIETVVETDPEADAARANFERARIVELCNQPQSVAEVAVSLHVPVGVAMVLIGDLVSEDMLILHHSDPVEIELDALTRMIDRVRTI